MSDEALAAARAYRQAAGAEVLREFAEFLALPNVGSVPADVQRNAVWIRDALVRRGARAATMALPGAAPVVTGRIDGKPGGPRIGIYAHYDGQPADPSRWTTHPFEPTLATGRFDCGGEVIPFPSSGESVDPEWRVYARGTADDRAQIMALLAALDARGGSVPETTVVFLLEGEEEQGSLNLPEYLDTLRDRLAADIWLICDGPVHQTGRPMVVFGVRGIAEVEIEVFGPPHDLHSGHYGNWAVNPAVLLSRLLASMVDDEGRAGVDGFAEGAMEIDGETAAAAAAVPDPGDLGYAPPPGEGYAARLLHPLLNVRGIRAADVGASARNVVPAQASASLDLRLVAGQDPDAVIEAVRRHVAAQGFHLVDGVPDDTTRRAHRRIARVRGTPDYPGVRSSPADPAAQRVLDAVARAGGEPPVVLPSYGGSVPLHHFEQILGVPPVIVPIANHDNNQHGPDENIRVGNLWYGIDLMAALLG